MSDNDRLTELQNRIAALENENTILTEKLGLFFDNSILGIIMIDERGLVVDWNKQASKVIGISKENVLGRYIWDVQYSFVMEEQKESLTLDFLKQAWQKEVFRLEPGEEVRGVGKIMNASGKEQYIEDLARSAYIGGTKFFFIYQHYLADPGLMEQA